MHILSTVESAAKLRDDLIVVLNKNNIFMLEKWVSNNSKVLSHI